MIGDGENRPWWYSGEDGEIAEPSAEPVDEPGADADAEGDGPETGQDSGAGMDWTLLVAGAQRMVDWATEKVMAPHAEHEDPAEHPQCVVCRTLVLVGDSGDLTATFAQGSDEEGAREAAPIAWIPIRGEQEGPSAGD